MRRYRIGEIARLSGLSLRTIRYYEEEGLIKAERTGGGQRWYRDSDLVYLKRIVELKDLGFSLQEIRRIFLLKENDENGNERRDELSAQYRAKLSDARSRIEKLESHAKELEWHIKQLERAEDGFTSCPGPLCASCLYKDRCIFFRGN